MRCLPQEEQNATCALVVALLQIARLLNRWRGKWRPMRVEKSRTLEHEIRVVERAASVAGEPLGSSKHDGKAEP